MTEYVVIAFIIGAALSALVTNWYLRFRASLPARLISAATTAVTDLAHLQATAKVQASLAQTDATNAASIAKLEAALAVLKAQ